VLRKIFGYTTRRFVVYIHLLALLGMKNMKYLEGYDGLTYSLDAGDK
jgi:hypothetical protein